MTLYNVFFFSFPFFVRQDFWTMMTLSLCLKFEPWLPWNLLWIIMVLREWFTHIHAPKVIKYLFWMTMTLPVMQPWGLNFELHHWWGCNKSRIIRVLFVLSSTSVLCNVIKIAAYSMCQWCFRPFSSSMVSSSGMLTFTVNSQAGSFHFMCEDPSSLQ